jgi:LCP family protein required for cell wall assembly
MRGILGKAGYSLSCAAAAVALVVSGFSYFAVQDVASISSSHAIVSGPSIGAQNILLMGLESRTDWAGNILPSNILRALHAGDKQQVEAGGGGNDTNTLILIHIPAGGKKAVGFSIPRDDWVNFAGTVGPQQQGKIDQAYGVSLYYKEQQAKAADPGISQDRLAYVGNEAGRTAAVETVEKLTGVHIDHFAEVNMDGFYELAKVLGGVEVCLRHVVKDPYSGANFHAGYQHLDAKQALAFVRQRHGLPNGDLDRTHRQQAFLDAVMAQLRTQGVLSDLNKMDSLLSVAKQYVITDAGWNLLDFASQMRSLTNGNLVFRTLPIEGYQTIDGQDANVVNPAYVKAIVHETFYPPKVSRTRRRAAETASRTTVTVLNGGNTAGLATRVSRVLTQDGYKAGKVGNTTYRTTTAVRYGPGAAASASKIAAMLGGTATASTTLAAGHVRVLLGASATVPVVTAPVVAPSPSPTVTVPNSGPQGGAVSAENGIPCVD